MLPLVLHDVGLAIDGQWLLRGISITLDAGAPTIVLGPNGAGKSLLLRLCHGLLRPSEGRLRWRDAQEDGQVGQAMVFQHPVVLRRSVAANVDYGLKLRRLPRARRRERVAEALALAGLDRLAGRPAPALSGGEQQRLALARAWALAPAVLFLDEPTASLDPAATGHVETILGRIAAAGTKVVMSTHDLGQARRLAGEVVFMAGGRVEEQAPAAAFFAGPRSSAAAAFLAGRLSW